MDNGYGVIHFKDWYSSYIPFILEEIYIKNIYGPYLHGKKDLTILDLGCNIGLFSMFATQFAKQIYAFEPTKETFEIAKKNIAENNITNVKLFQKAIMKDDGNITFYHSENSTMNSAMASIQTEEFKIVGKEEVEGIRLDTFVKQEGITHIDFMKVDCEGSESEIIGGKGFENIASMVDSLIVEYHVWSGVNVQQLVTTLRDYGYKVNLIPSQAVILGCKKI